jgi:hypothetical protein
MQRIRTAILALAALAAILPGGPVFAQAAKNETVFLQGTERHPARILPGRFALVLSDSIVTDADRYQEALDSLKGKPVNKQTSKAYFNFICPQIYPFIRQNRRINIF